MTETEEPQPDVTEEPEPSVTEAPDPDTLTQEEPGTDNDEDENPNLVPPDVTPAPEAPDEGE